MTNLSMLQLSANYTAPRIIESSKKEWVEYGDDNNYYQYLIDLYYGSPSNNACIKGIADLIYGQGPEVIKGDRHLEGYLDFKKIFHSDCLRNCSMDLKMLGQCAIHLVKSKDKKKIVAAYHWPIQSLRPKKANKDGEIEAYYYVADWSKLKRGQQPKEFKAFGFDKGANECMIVIKPYSTGNFYFAPPDYQGGTQWAELECEISNFHLNNIKNGMAPSMLINFNNGQPPQEVKQMIEGQIADKFSGSSNSGKWIISWNDNAETKADITPIQLSDAHNQYQFLSSETMMKVMMSHRVTSPMLLGIKDQTGLGNNAEELKTASILFDNIVIRPFQRLLIDAMQKILNFNGHSLDIYFKTLQPLEFTDFGNKNLTQETKEKELGMAMSRVDLVDPKRSESQEEFMARCIPVVISEGKDSDQAVAICSNIFETKLAESYTDYPEAASNNAKKALKWAEKHGWGQCGEATGKKRANQLANREPISRDTIARMAAFERHRQHKDVPYSEGCGGLMWDAWGGSAGIQWAQSKLKEIDAKLMEMGSHFSLIDMTKEDEDSWMTYLQEKGEIMDPDEWELIDTQWVEDPDHEATIDEFNFFKRFADKNAKSNDDKGIYKIRYRYGPDALKSNSRIFCKDMIANRNMGVVYRREDIVTMGEAGINGQFAPRGKSSYSIWKYKGGVACHHRWERLTFKRKQMGNGKVLKLDPSEEGSEIRNIDKNYTQVSNEQANSVGVPFSPPSWETAETRPIDMPNQGRLNKK